MIATATRTTLRKATLDDIPQMVAMGSRFIAQTSYRDVVADNPAARRALGETLISGQRSNIFISERDDRITGMLAMIVFQNHIDGAWTAGEVFWWSDPDVRGDGIRLFHFAESWAIEMGCDKIQMIAPDERIEKLYAQLGFAPLERSFQRDLVPGLFAPLSTRRWPESNDQNIQVVDNVLVDADAYRARALRCDFGDVPDNGVTFHGISIRTPSRELEGFIAAHFPGLRTTQTALRQSPEGQTEPHLIHSDLTMGLWSAILYLTPNPAPGDGTSFWQRKDGAREATAGSEADYMSDAATWFDRSLWAPWYVVPAAFNRLVLFPSRLYHSRARENYGRGDDSRLIQIAFGDFA